MSATTIEPADAPVPARAADVALAPARVRSIDVLRGLVIVLMALDHVRDFFTNARFDPLDLAHTDVALYATRWITHFCAPVFVLLAGTSAFLVSQRTTKRQLSAFLLKRGLWLIVLEVTVVMLAWTFAPDFRFGVVLQVIWAIGASMIVLAALVHLPLAAVGAIGIAMIAMHNLLDGIAPESFGELALLWNVLHVPGRAPFGFIGYPLIPWIGVMAAGYALGVVYTWDAARRRRFLYATGAALILGFMLLRWIDGYGDARHWAPQADATFTVMSFLNVSKYPPSLLYCAITLGPGLIALAALERTRGGVSSILDTFGRVPLFAYVGHIVLAHLLAGLIGLALGFGSVILLNIFFVYPDTWGFDLPLVYLAWLVVLALLYPACRWFAGVKARRRDWWLSYL